MSTSFLLEPRGSFSLRSISSFQCGLFTSSRSCAASRQDVTLAFPSDDGFQPVAVRLRLEESQVAAQVYGQTVTPALVKQVSRILTLDHDGSPFDELLSKDPILQKVASSKPGFRPVVFYSPYVAAGWGILSQRTRMSQAASLIRKISQDAGDTIEVEGQVLTAFPRPESFLRRAGFPGVPEIKWQRLQGIARAALEGAFDIERLQKEPYAQAQERLMSLPGVGQWTADMVLMRGVGPTDTLPLSEPTLHRAVALAYGLSRVPKDKEVERLAESWRPFRMWVSILLISHSYQNPKIDNFSLTVR